MHKLLKLLGFFLLFTFTLFSKSIQYAPIMVGDIVTFVPYSHVKVSLGNDKFMKEGEEIVLSLNLSYADDVVSYVWREGNRVINTKSTLSLKSFPIGTHNITITVIDINGLQTTDSIKVVIGSKEYVGKRTKAVLNSDNYIKFVRASNLIEHIKFKHFLSCYGEGVSAVNRIDDSTKVGYIVQNFTNYDYGEFAFYGKQNIRLNGYYRFDKYENTYQIDTDLTFLSNENNITIKAKMHTSDNNGTQKEYIDKYYIYDEKYHENIEILDINTEHPKLYIGSEGYVTIDVANDNFLIYGEHNTELSVVFKQEEAIYETKDLEIEPITYQSRIYSPKYGQGTIESILNGVSQKNLYFLPYQVSFFEPPKFYENYGNAQLLEYAFYSWHIKYQLLNENKNDIEITIEWFINGEKVDTPFMYELPLNSYLEDDTIKVSIYAQRGDITTKTEQLLTDGDVNYRVSSGNYEYPSDTYDIVYRTNNTTFDMNLLSHEYFNQIDVENSKFSWTVFNSLNQELEKFSILSGTQYNKAPTVTYLESLYGYTGSIYLKIYSNDEIKVVRFNITLEKGTTGIDTSTDIIESIEEANLTNSPEFISMNHIEHFDNDNNGLDDIIYTSTTTSGNFLNVSYQNAERTFELDKIIISGTPYIGDFDGDKIKEAFIFGYSSSGSKVLSLEKGNIHTQKDINISGNMNILNIKAIADMNNDGKDDLLVANNQEGKLYIYKNLDDLTQTNLVGSEQCEVFVVQDINNDGLKDIICTPVDKLNYLYTESGADYFSSDLIIKYYLQNVDNSFTINSRQYSLINNAKSQQAAQVRVHGAVIIDNSNIAVSLQDKDGHMLYICDLNNDSTEPQGITPTNTTQIATFFTSKDINHDGLNDLISYQDYSNGRLNIFYQKENLIFESDYKIDLASNYSLTTRLLSNAFLDDIDNDGSLEIVTINGENKFSYINFK